MLDWMQTCTVFSTACPPAYLHKHVRDFQSCCFCYKLNRNENSHVVVCCGEAEAGVTGGTMSDSMQGSAKPFGISRDSRFDGDWFCVT